MFCSIFTRTWDFTLKDEMVPMQPGDDSDFPALDPVQNSNNDRKKRRRKKADPNFSVSYNVVLSQI